ncbi:N-acetylglucosaminyl transferase component-domain-containing protein [Filobasidium floriforme]|uniref:N-acetylglucosaminyl transferase component-domain-containing protein n=1 Tax=Filobasidium floriforme TaxID=5210 RepID=UPI001E8E12EB|nr:N-acetylglucosaminyl transferase component-domain-containing protein [Filobasidium floriforme]KAH8079672.1 N-acetylglucosaminyl transferase component-domain-containing protein [Filobasidium floriforme]
MQTIFWPNDIKITVGHVLGLRISSSAHCVVDVTPVSESPIDTLQHRADSAKKKLLIGRIDATDGTLGGSTISIFGQDGTESTLTSCSSILFTPPNPNRLRFLTLKAISVTPKKLLEPHQVAQLRAVSQLDSADCDQKSLPADIEATLETAVQAINQCFQLRRQYRTGVQAVLQDPRTAFSPEIVHPSSTEWRILAFLLRISAIARQSCLRYTQLRQAPAEWQRLKLDLHSEGSLRQVSVRYVQFCNTIWLIINDLIFGWTIVRILDSYRYSLIEPVASFQKRWLVEAIQASLRWLDDWPVGLKLNTPLSAILCITFGQMADIWDSIWTSSSSLVPRAILLLSLGSYLGGSMFLSVMQDLIGLSTLHLTVISWIMRQIYRWEVSAMYSLWNLFRGKRWNTLRHRVDSYDYEIDQLFLGTLLFTVTIFLLPTIFTYYAFFSLVQIALLACNFSIETALAFINSFPLFALMLRIKEPSRLPGGVSLELKRDRKGCRLGPHLELKNVPLSLGAIFSGFGASWADLSAQYSPAKLLLGIIRGVL